MSVIGSSSAFRELGPSTLYGQQVSGFLMVLSEEAELPLVPDGSAAEAVVRHVPPVTLEVFIRGDGVPVRIHYRNHREGSVATEDLRAFNTPIRIVAPPASEVIEERELERLLRRRAKSRR